MAYRRRASPFGVEEVIPVRHRGERFVAIRYREPLWIWSACAALGVLTSLLALSVGGAYLWIGLHTHSDLERDIDALEDFTELLNDTCCGEPIDGDELCTVANSSLTLDCIAGVNVVDPDEGQILRFNESTEAWENQECNPCVDGAPGINGTDGADGADGDDGINCWDINGNGLCDLPIEDVNGDGVCNQTDCLGDPGMDGMDGANATIDDCDKPFGQLCLANGTDPELVDPFTLNMTINTWIPLTGITCGVKAEDNINVSTLGCQFIVTRNDTYKITIDTSFQDNTPPEEAVWVGLSVNNATPEIKDAFPSDTGHFHTMSFSLALYLEEGDVLSVQYYSVNSSGLVDVFRLQFTAVGELLCGFDVTGQPGPQGVAGPAGIDGFSCWDTNQNYFCDLPDEDINGDGFCSVLDCTLANITFDNITGDICPRLEETGNLDCLADIDIGTPTDGDYLCWNDTSGEWTNGPITYDDIGGDLCAELGGETLDCLGDVEAGGVSPGDYLSYNGTVWEGKQIEYADIGGDLCAELNGTSIDCLGDVDLTGVQENDTLIYQNGQLTTTSIQDSEIFRRLLANSTIPTNFRFNDPNGDPACTTSSSFVVLSSFVYLGTATDIRIERVLAIVSTTNAAAVGEFRITDLTNTATIVSATSYGPTSGTLAILDMETITNLPTGAAILQIGIRRSSMMGGGSACLHSIQVLG